MHRYATIDLGTNTALLLVAEKTPSGFVPLIERAEVTRLGQGVDRDRRLQPQAIDRTVSALVDYARQAREAGAERIAAVATSAARDALNRDELIERLREKAGLALEILPGEQEANLTYLGATFDLDLRPGTELAVLDIGGGSTELILGSAGERAGHFAFRHSFDVGSVRLTERFLRSDPPQPIEITELFANLRETFSAAPRPEKPPLFVGVAGTVTTLFSLVHEIEPYDSRRVHRASMSLGELRAIRERLFGLTVAERKALRGMEPKRADVVAAGAAILEGAMERLGVDRLTVSDRGLRWGLMHQRFGAGTD